MSECFHFYDFILTLFVLLEPPLLEIGKYIGKQGAPLCEECCREQKQTWAVKFQRPLHNIPFHKQILQSKTYYNRIKHEKYHTTLIP